MNDDAQEELTRLPAADPKPLYAFLEQASRSYKQFGALAAAVRLRLFDELEKANTVRTLAAQLRTDPQLTGDLCDLLADMGFLSRNSTGFENTPVSRVFLHSRSAYFQEAVIENIASGLPLWQRLDQVCRHGPVRVDQADFFENNLIDSLASEIMAGELQNTVAAIIRQPEFQTARRVLDLGGGHGLYAMALCRQKPGLDAVVFDFPPIEGDFQRYKERWGSPRVRFSPGNLFADDWGRDFDLVLFSYNPGGKNPHVLEKIRTCLTPGGLFITKHAFYRRNEGSKDKLLDIEWQLTAFEGTRKERHVYYFAGDLCLEEYLELLGQYFTVLEVIETEEFASPPLSKFGDRLDSKIIISRKK